MIARPFFASFLLIPGFVVAWTAPLAGQVYEGEVVDAARRVLDEIMLIPARRIPESMLAQGEGLVIIPGLLKGGFIVGVRHGRGVALVRESNGAWRGPVFVTLTGGSVGWQAGIQATDLILVLMTRNSVEGLMRGKFTIGADAAAAAGPIGRQATAATDARLKAEIYSYSRSRGVFAGISVDGSALQVDHLANSNYYGGPTPSAGAGSAQALPPSAVRLLEQLDRYAPAPVRETSLRASATGPLLPPLAATSELAVRRQLADSSRRLDAWLDATWRSYLALPAEVYGDRNAPTAASIREALARFDAVQANVQYRPLAARPEFQSTRELLRQYDAVLTAPRDGTLALPPPPQRALHRPN